VAFVLHVLEGYSMEEIGAIVNASVPAVKVRVHDARLEIEKRLRREPELLAAWREGVAP
jgi:DNA-directed RNA polymerase specialized sigma24 family protein